VASEQPSVAGEVAPESGAGSFAGMQQRDSVNSLIRNTQQHLVALSSQADFKASILITASSVVLTIGLAQAKDSRFVVAFATLAVFLLMSLLAAVLCVLPAYRPSDRKLDWTTRSPNLLFFGDFVTLDEDDFVDRFGRLSGDDTSVYVAQARDLHRQGKHILHHKYRYLRFGYLTFLTGFLASAAAVFVTVLVD
jgi:hypothetical protein